MASRAVLLAFAALASAAPVPAADTRTAEVVITSSRLDGDESIAELRLGHSRVFMPPRTRYSEALHNEAKTIFALNFHETSDYDDIDLFVVEGDSVIIRQNLWNSIGLSLVTAKVLPQQYTGRIHLYAVSIKGDRIQCKLTARNERVDLLRRFSVRVVSVEGRTLRFEILP